MSTTRRTFLKTSLGAAALASLGRCPRGLAATDPTGQDPADTVLVVVELAGGNDGLNTVVPFENDIYARSRTSLRLSKKDVLPINDELGFHPALAGLRRLFDEGHLSVVQGVGYPNPEGGHDEAVLDWHSGLPHQTNRQTGWIGRALDAMDPHGGTAASAVVVGQASRPFCVAARRAIVPLVRTPQDLTLQPAGSADAAAGHRRRLVEAAGTAGGESGNPLLDHVRKSRRAACASAARIEEVLHDKQASGDYPRLHLADQLRTVSQLIRADIGIRVFRTGFGGGIGGFDNHANQRDNHASLLRHLSESVAAFIDDLARQNLLDRVVLMTFSEFGRTVAENGRKGTDHASAAPVFLAGGRLKGDIIGDHPSLTELENGGPTHHTDFRRLYATVLEAWLGFDARAAVGEGFEPLEVFEG